MEKELEGILEKILEQYPNAKGVTFHSMELPISVHKGEHTDILEKYKDIPMLSMDETFNTSFTFIVIETGSIIIFFINNMHFISVFTDSTELNKELANRMFDAFSAELSELLNESAV